MEEEEKEEHVFYLRLSCLGTFRIWLWPIRVGRIDIPVCQPLKPMQVRPSCDYILATDQFS